MHAVILHSSNSDINVGEKMFIFFIFYLLDLFCSHKENRCCMFRLLENMLKALCSFFGSLAYVSQNHYI